MNKNKYKISLLSFILLPIISFANIEILDGDKDGIINPYEALDVLLQLQKVNNKELTTKNFNSIVSDYKKHEEQEMSEWIEEFDQNGDGKLIITEARGEIKEFIHLIDADKNGEVTKAEMLSFDFTSVYLASDEDIKQEIDELFKEHKSDIVDLSKVSKDKFIRTSALDGNHDGKITREEAYSFMKANNTPITFIVKGNVAFMSGVITSTTPASVLQLLFEHPNVTTIEMMTVPGSIDDVANIRAAMYVSKFGLMTKLNSNSYIASGGTDFFLAGKQRIVEDGARLGVHSWGGGSIAAKDVPKDDPVHQKYLDYYNSVGIPEAFYWYTLEAASARDMHLMSEEEIKLYEIRLNNKEMAH
jgi:hypothetical protein